MPGSATKEIALREEDNSYHREREGTLTRGEKIFRLVNGTSYIFLTYFSDI